MNVMKQEFESNMMDLHFHIIVIIVEREHIREVTVGNQLSTTVIIMEITTVEIMIVDVSMEANMTERSSNQDGEMERNDHYMERPQVKEEEQISIHCLLILLRVNRLKYLINNETKK
jgi:hypothetical protein